MEHDHHFCGIYVEIEHTETDAHYKSARQNYLCIFAAL